MLERLPVVSSYQKYVLMGYLRVGVLCWQSSEKKGTPRDLLCHITSRLEDAVCPYLITGEAIGRRQRNSWSEIWPGKFLPGSDIPGGRTLDVRPITLHCE